MGADLLDVWGSCAKSIAGVYAMAGAGYVLQAQGVLDRNTRQATGKLLLYWLYPCLVFSSAMRVVSLDALGDLYVVVLLPVAHLLMNYAVGVPMALLLVPEKRLVLLRRILAASVAWTNSGDIPVALIAAGPALFADSDRPDETDSERVERGIGYISLYVLLWAIIAWSVLWSSLDHVDVDVDVGMNLDKDNVLGQKPESVEMLPDNGRSRMDEEPAVAVVVVGTTNGTAATTAAAAAAAAESGLWFAVKKLARTPPLVATVVAVICGVIAPIKALFFATDDDGDDSPPLLFVTDLLVLVGRAAIPMSMLVLGANVACRQNEQAASTRKSPLAPAMIATIVVVRLAVTAGLGLGLGLLLVSAGLVSANNILLKFVCMVTNCTPSATTLVVQSQLKGAYQTEVSVLVFYQYLVAVIVLPFTVTAATYLAQQGGDE